MQTTESQQVIVRFFAALDYLRSTHAIRGKQTFTRRNNINRRNLYKLEKDHSSDIFQVSWLTSLVRDYGISAEWLLTGEGDIKTQ